MKKEPRTKIIRTTGTSSKVKFRKIETTTPTLEIIKLLNVEKWFLKKANKVESIPEDRARTILFNFYNFNNTIEEIGDVRDIKLVKMEAGIIKKVRR